LVTAFFHFQGRWRVARRTKEVKVSTTVRISPRDRDLVYLAARREGISQSQFVRAAVVEKAQRSALAQATGK
jgi:uncharacterized protein (DUF1778 family)